MSVFPEPLRIMKHAVFQFLPGHIGIRNRACLHHLTKPSAAASFQKALDMLSEGDICIDCGANVGEISEKFAARGARTYAFEPDPWSFGKLSARLQDRSNVTLFNKAVGVEEGSIEFFRDAAFADQPDLHSLASSVYPRPDREQTSVKVEVIDLIAFIRSLEVPVKILKMDIEGAEVEVLEKLIEEGMAAQIGHVFVETHELQFAELLESTARLRRTVSDNGLGHINLDWH
jgi:FkbM family methyltransferase